MDSIHVSWVGILSAHVGGGAHTRVPTNECGIVLRVRMAVKMQNLAQASAGVRPGMVDREIDHSKDHHPNRDC